MVSVDFAPIEVLQHQGDWDALACELERAARHIEVAGAELLLICTNTMHKVAGEVAAAVNIPLLHIADATADVIEAAGHSTVGLLGTRFTMEEDFYRGRLEARGIRVLTPGEADRETVHRVIYDELCQGTVSDESRSRFLEIIARLGDAGAEAVIEGCTEIGMLVGPEHTSMPLLDTTVIHAHAAVSMALET
jgi:aspartate racemase